MVDLRLETRLCGCMEVAFLKSHNIGKAVDKFGGNNLLSTEIGSKLKEARTS